MGTVKFSTMPDADRTALKAKVLVGGDAVDSLLSLKSTTANGTAAAKGFNVLVGNNGATEAIIVLNNGTVGIGNTAPAELSGWEGTTLNINDSTISNVYITKGANYVNMGLASNFQFRSNVDLLFVTAANSPISLWTNSTRRMTIDGTNGNIGIGEATPTAALHLKAGTATASTAPLKLTSGVNLTTPEDGAFEFDGTNLYFTVGGVRKTVTLT